ncbi:hypothetical protein MRB53_031085 [Persea americana]|uniref:Uncharacterized protein n=1 Tax=Persea americana TaxID=3435 RepID=A0ACC2KMZ4_PERAE|nr:hypothetical protein MRB53_031085 [Persea americana]
MSRRPASRNGAGRARGGRARRGGREDKRRARHLERTGPAGGDEPSAWSRLSREAGKGIVCAGHTRPLPARAARAPVSKRSLPRPHRVIKMRPIAKGRGTVAAQGKPMSESIKIDYSALADSTVDAGGGGTLVVFASGSLDFGRRTADLLGETGAALVKRAASAAKFKGKNGSALDIIAPAGLAADRLLVVGVGSEDASADGGKDKGKPFEPTNLGGAVAGKVGRGTTATVLFDLPRPVPDENRALAEFTTGLRLRDYKFDTYKTKKKKDEPEEDGATKVTIAVADPDAARAAAGLDAVADGVITARQLVNEPPNVLYPEAFADRLAFLKDVGVEIEVLDIPAMGEARHGRLPRPHGNGGEAAKPVAFIGKGVTFDTGGISIKPSGGMEDMKGDMAGAACVVGLMQALAGRKAKVDAIGAIGIVENMPGPDAQRPGDIVTSMSGQTIEIINTDAEGRLVLADVCWYVQDRYKPAFMVDLATLTGAIIVALGQEHGGLFSNDDELADRLLAAGKTTGEKLWRMPLAPAYDKLIDSKFADVKNSGGRHASSITAAQFIQRFVNDVPWAHLDIAGMGMSSPATDINQSWGSGWGVRLLNRLVEDHYETH